VAELVTDVPAVTLAVYAHPDDADVACAGTLARWASLGSQVHLLVCTDGGRGTADPSVRPEDLAHRRAEELSAAAAVVGLTTVRVLGAADGDLDQRPGFRAELVHEIRTVKPDVVLGHDPTAIFFGQDYFNHRDHRVAGWTLLDAVSPSAVLPHYYPEAGPPHQVSTVYLSGTLEPDVWVDISDTVDAKAAAVECHRSQITGGERWASAVVRHRAEEEGRRAGVGFAEGFRRLRLGG
jgi:LmbE family N-acetylglucosaminyl deacetylase